MNQLEKRREKKEISSLYQEKRMFGENIFMGIIKVCTDQISSFQWADEFFTEQIELFIEILILILNKLLIYWTNK